MSEAKAKSFMQELDMWTETTVIGRVESASGSADFGPVVETVKKAIRTKVLESYRNGQAAGPRKFPVRQ